MKRVLLVAFTVLWPVGASRAGDWPMYRADAARTGYTSESLSADLAIRWVHKALHAPRPAWPRSNRQPFDRAYHTVVADGTLYYGSSADCKVYALDAATGRKRWSFMTGAPVRFAPAVWKDRVFVVSDDGYLYCLAADDGKVLWKHRGGPNAQMVLGNGRMISRWPARGGPLVVDNVVIFAAGIWPSEGIYLYTLDAATGRVIWCNDKAGGIVWDQPHGGAKAKSGVSAQGYLVATGDKLFVPTGRAVPAAFNRADGKLAYFHLQAYGHYGGTTTALIDDHLFNANCVFSAENGKIVTRGIKAASVAPGADTVIHAAGSKVCALDRAKPFVMKTEKREKKTIQVPVPNVKWTMDVPGGADKALIVAGDRVVCASADRVKMIDPAAKTVTWSTEVEGVPYGLAVADGRLYVSTDRGVIYCFDRRGRIEGTNAVEIKPQKAGTPGTDAYGAAAEEIARKTGITEGYCLDLGCGTGRLARRLIERTKLQIYAVDPDPEKVKRARAMLSAAGLYGVRVTVHQADPAKTDYPKYFADLIVSERSMTAGADVVPTAEVTRLQRPYGGVACLGKPGAMVKTVRGPLKGAGEWTHQYCTAANTGCSTDTIAKGPLGVLWFDRPAIQTPNRHGRGPAPLFMDGRLFTAGVDKICALNAYNGRLLWEHKVPGFTKSYHQEHLMGVAGTNSSYCAADGSVYVGWGPRCFRLDASTGRRVATLVAPQRPDGKTGRWGTIACTDGVLYGTLINPKHLVPFRFLEADMRQQFTESVSLFAMDAETGKHMWTYAADKSIRHNTVAVGGGRVFLIDRGLAWEPPRRSKETRPHPTGELLTLDAQTGKVVWRTDEDVWGTVLELSVKHDALLMCYQPTRFRLGSEIGGKFRVYRASTGKLLWDRNEKYISRPLINDRTIYAQPGAWDLLTGEPERQAAGSERGKRWQFTRSYGCGIISASPNLLLFRSATIGYVDLLRDAGTENYGGIRPGCWINLLPVGGVVLAPDATNVCGCSYLNKATIALQQME